MHQLNKMFHQIPPLELIIGIRFLMGNVVHGQKRKWSQYIVRNALESKICNKSEYDYFKF